MNTLSHKYPGDMGAGESAENGEFLDYSLTGYSSHFVECSPRRLVVLNERLHPFGKELQPQTIPWYFFHNCCTTGPHIMARGRNAGRLNGNTAHRDVPLDLTPYSMPTKRRRVEEQRPLTAAQEKSASEGKKKECFIHRLSPEVRRMIYELCQPFERNDEVPNLVVAFRGNVQLHHEVASLYFGNGMQAIDVSWRSKRLFATAIEVELRCIRCLRLDFR